MIIVAAAGNDDTEEPSYPAAYDHVIAVAAAASGKKADYSNYGPHVDLVVDTAKRKYVTEQRISSDVTRVSIRTEVGTSLSAPKLAGMLALAWDADPHKTREDLLSAMTGACFPMQGDEHYGQGNLGKGRLDDYAMMFVHSPVPTRMALLLLAELVLLLGIHILFSRKTRRLGIVTFFLFVLGVFIACVLCGLADTLIWGYTFTALAYALFLGLYLLLRIGPRAAKKEQEEDPTDEPWDQDLWTATADRAS